MHKSECTRTSVCAYHKYWVRSKTPPPMCQRVKSYPIITPIIGDSGGPMVKAFGDNFVLVGVTSWGPKNCADDTEPGVWVDVAKYTVWIKKNIKFSDTTKQDGAKHPETDSDLIKQSIPDEKPAENSKAKIYLFVPLVLFCFYIILFF